MNINTFGGTILRTLKRYRKNGATADRIVELTGIRRDVVSSYLSKFRREGQVAVLDRTRKSRAGRDVLVYQMVAQG